MSFCCDRSAEYRSFPSLSNCRARGAEIADLLEQVIGVLACELGKLAFRPVGMARTVAVHATDEVAIAVVVILNGHCDYDRPVSERNERDIAS